MIENVILTTENCRYCLMCRHVCPVEKVTALESHSPHGWGLLIASQRRGLVEWNEDTVNVLYSCADCGTCRAHCVTDQPLPAAIAAARAEVAAQDIAPAIVYEVYEALQSYRNPFEKQSPPDVKENGEIALFVGDEAQYLRPAALEAVLKLLKAVGVEPVLIGVGRNNGYLATSLGFPELAASLVQETLDELKATGAKQMMVLSPGDYFAFSKMHDERIGITWPEDIEIGEVMTFLADQLAAGKLNFKQTDPGLPYAYLDPTHTVRVPSRLEAPRKLLQAVMPNPGVELFWRRERAHPVGNTALRWTNPHIANHLTYAQLGGALEAGARLLICEDPGSLHTISLHSERFGLRVQGLYELLAEQLA